MCCCFPKREVFLPELNFVLMAVFRPLLLQLDQTMGTREGARSLKSAYRVSAPDVSEIPFRGKKASSGNFHPHLKASVHVKKVLWTFSVNATPRAQAV